ncbi:MAG: pseudouridine synthase [Terriglobales bacterium]
MAGGRNPRRVGLARVLSKLGYCSRTRARELIKSGRVLLNGVARRNPEFPVRVDEDKIEVDHRVVSAAEKVYLLLNKPRGVVTTASDEKGRRTVYDLLDNRLPWVAPVGRLDKASEGLLLLTNDSEWSARVADPATHLDKTYHVQIGAIPGEDLLSAMMRGIKSEEGDTLKAKRCGLLRQGKRNAWLEIIVDEGKNRHIRRLIEQFQIEVLRLVRVSIGPLILGSVRKGEVRFLSSAEKNSIDEAMRTVKAGIAKDAR